MDEPPPTRDLTILAREPNRPSMSPGLIMEFSYLKVYWPGRRHAPTGWWPESISCRVPRGVRIPDDGVGDDPPRAVTAPR